MTNSLLLIAEAILYFSLMVMPFRLRRRIGIGVFMCALGVMHFLETYLASVFYIALPFGMLSPGSTVMFSGKLAMLLLLYIKEDATAVRQPIYGLLFGNVLMIGLVLVLRLHDLAPLPDGRLPDIPFVDQMGWLMVWGTVLLFVDAIAHGSARRTNPGNRRIAVYRYGPSWGHFRLPYRPSPELLERLTPRRRSLVYPHGDVVLPPGRAA